MSAIALLQNAGMRVTHDWIPTVQKAIAEGVAESDLDEDRARSAAHEDIAGVIAADVLVLLAPSVTTRGAWFEAGVAHAMGIPIVVAHDDADKRNQSIFLRLGVPVPDAGIVNAAMAVTRERGSLLSQARFIRWIAGQIITHAVKLERTSDPDRARSLREQIAGDLHLVAVRGIAATHSFFGGE